MKLLKLTPAVILLMMLSLTVGLKAADDEEKSDATKLLESQGLTLAGSTWVLPLDKEINSEMGKVRRLASVAKKAQNEARKADRNIRRVKSQLAAWEYEHDKLVKETRKSMTDNKYNRIVEEINKLETQINAARSHRDEREAEMSELIDEALGAYAEELIEFHEIAEATTKRYEELEKDEAVQNALKTETESAGRKITLGPSSNFARQWKTLKRMREDIRAGEISLEKEGNSLWVDVKINGKPTRQMVLDTGASYLSLPHDFTISLGIEVTDKHQTVQVSLADGRLVDGKLVVLETVQIGQFLRKDIEAIVLPEDLIAATPLLGNSYLKNFIFRVDPEKGRLRLTEKANRDEGGDY